MRHTLTDKDLKLETATCAVCGPVKIKIRKDRSPQCYTAWTNQKGTKTKPANGWPKKHRDNHTFSYPYDGGRTIIKRSERNRLFEESTKLCSICDAALTLQTAQYDHCHIDGHFRGWLCADCNKGIGFFKDNRDRLLKAIEYLEN